VAQKSTQAEVVLNVEEALDIIDKTMERVKSLYEQYFLGIQKQPPTFIHNDLERKLRDLQQVQIRNTALRYRYATLQQKFGSYNSYWRRTLRQIENGTYVRQLAKIGRKSAESGEDIPEEILAKMPKRMREQVRRDREAALALAQRRHQLDGTGEGLPDDGDFYEDFSRPAAPAGKVDARGAHLLSEDDADIDLDKFFAQVEADEENETTQSGPPPQPIPVTPSAPANQRAAMLGGLPRAQSPAIRPAPTPAAFAPPGREQEPPAPSRASQPGVQPLGAAFAKTQAIPTVPMPARPSQPGIPAQRPSQPAVPSASQPGAPRASLPAIPPRPSQPGLPPLPTPPPTEPMRTQPMPAIGRPPANPASGPTRTPGAFAPSQGARPNPIAPGSSANKQVEVETMAGPFARESSSSMPPRRAKRDTDVDGGTTPAPVPAAPTPPARPSQQMRAAPTPQRPSQQMRAAPTPSRPGQPINRPAGGRPPPGMSDADVDALYAKYVKAKEMVGEQTNAQTYGKLLNTINAQAPKIMEQYKAKGVDFSVVVKDNQVIIKAKPKP